MGNHKIRNMEIIHKFLGVILILGYLSAIGVARLKPESARNYFLYMNLIYFFQIMVGGLMVMMGSSNSLIHYLLGLFPILTFGLSGRISITSASILNSLALIGAAITGMGGAS